MKSEKFIIIDTGFFIALLSKTDKFHKRALACRSEIANRTWITTWPVLTETSHLLDKKKFLAGLFGILSLVERGGIKIFDISSEHLPRIKCLLEKYSDLPMDLADASLVLLAEELDHGDILSTDQRDFKAYRFKNRKPFRNLLVP